ncbi:substrate-binding domain-containing protein [Sphingobacterium sp. SGG-5]|uniref:LacI family DNA-binding transcriptional regulator n=1 Tax=Sphingobacterium sp. SGG-5 TaxID=2710881 RepID=UPI0013ED3E3C|nr:substrate-binding domain-containing protein [Sphingobacterium sp. SGG-5]NGM63487.1 substrate-binding domain-containing protein [Sphingobacterium sp. SGG-5]
MPRVKCPKCGKVETILKSGFVRGVQRYYCKECIYHFTLIKKGRYRSSSFDNKRQTTIIDIAKAVGVSASTVSRALKNHEDIGSRTKALVKQAAIELDYQPNLLAQSLNRRETHVIGVVVPDIENPFFASVLSGIQHTASASGYKVMIYQSNESHKTEAANIQTIMNNWIDGLLICHSKETQTFEHLKLQMKKGIPIVHFDRICEETATSKVLLDNVTGAKQIVTHLLNEGCRRIAVIAGPKHLYITKKRIEGYESAFKNANIELNERWIAYTDFTKSSIHDAIDNWLMEEIKPEAIFCISDNSAILTMMYLKHLKLKIPEDICVAGFGNDYTGRIIEPALTTYDPHAFKVGETATKLFFDQVILGDKFEIKTVTIAGELIVRSSSLKRSYNPSDEEA